MLLHYRQSLQMGNFFVIAIRAIKRLILWLHLQAGMLIEWKKEVLPVIKLELISAKSGR